MKQILVAFVVVFIATTPTVIDAWQIWDKPDQFHDGVSPQQVRIAIAIWYLALIIVALSAYKMFA